VMQLRLFFWLLKELFGVYCPKNKKTDWIYC
jgi:hypothetical protein